jgi:hypothetical protein
MNEKLVLLQLVFNFVMFVALAVVVWRTRGLAGRRREKARRRTPAEVPAPAPVLGLDALVAQAEQTELAAEAALRARIAQFKNRAVS